MDYKEYVYLVFEEELTCLNYLEQEIKDHIKNFSFEKIERILIRQGYDLKRDWEIDFC